MPDTKEQGLALLKEAKETLLSCNYEKENCQVLERQVTALEHSLSSIKKTMENEISTQVRTERQGIKDQFSDDLDLHKNQLEKMHSQKAKAKTKAQKARILSETASLMNENKRLKKNTSVAFKDAGVPTIFNRPLFYQIFTPHGTLDILTLVASFLIIGIIIPTLIYLLIPNHRISFLIILCLVFIAIYVLMYILIYQLTKKKAPDTIISGRRNYDVILSNLNKAYAISKSIEADTDESSYNLDTYDAEISKIQASYDDVNNRCQQALEDFKANRCPQIEESIRTSHQAQINQCQADYDDAHSNLKAAKDRYQTLSDVMATKYTSVIGKRFMKEDALTSLEKLLSSGQANSIKSAVELYKKLPK